MAVLHNRYFSRIITALLDFRRNAIRGTAKSVVYTPEYPKMKLAVITCTGGRLDAFKLCAKYVMRQSYKDFLWIVIDDGPDHVETQKIVDKWPNHSYVYNMSNHGKTENTLPDNFSIALTIAEQHGCDYIAVMEDDDWYRKDYLETLVDDFKSSGSAVIGMGQCVYYNIAQRRYNTVNNNTYAPLAGTAFHADLIPIMRGVIKDSAHYKTFDIAFWRSVEAQEIFLRGIFDRTYIGIKGMPGRKGLGMGHSPKPNWLYDPELTKLEAMIGKEDAAAYVPFVQENKLVLVDKG